MAYTKSPQMQSEIQGGKVKELLHKLLQWVSQIVGVSFHVLQKIEIQTKIKTYFTGSIKLECEKLHLQHGNVIC